MNTLVLLALAVGGALLWLAVVTRRAHLQRRRAQAAYFSALAPLFDGMAGRIEPSGFPRMTARLGKDGFDLQALPDSLTFRKLPALWVMVTLPAPLPVNATLDIMARPGGLETFSRFSGLPQTLPTPARLPEGTVIRTDDARSVPPLSLLEPYFGIFSDPRVKELVVSPKGLRLVILAEEAERGRYLIFRDSELGGTPLAPERVKPLIDTLLALRDRLNEAP